MSVDHGKRNESQAGDRPGKVRVRTAEASQAVQPTSPAIRSKPDEAQAPHLPPYSEPNEHGDSVAHRKLLLRAERTHNACIDALEGGCIR
jgi:hypothetical protein